MRPRPPRAIAILFVLSLLFAVPATTLAEGDGATAWGPAPTSPSGAAVWGLGGSSTVLVASTISSGTFYSNDDGRSWQPAATDVDEGEIAADPTNPDRVFYAGFGGLDRTTDAGATWTTLLTHSPVQRVAVADDGTVAASARIAGGDVQLFVSHDNGDTWIEYDSPVPNFNSVYAVAFGATSQDIVMMTIGKTWTSHDGGATWAETAGGGRDLVRTDDGAFWQTGFGGLLRSTDNGDTWVEVTMAGGTPSVLAPRPGGGLYGASGNGVVLTTDDGATWTDMGYADIAFAATAILADPEDPDAVLMGDENMGVNRIYPTVDGYGFEGRSAGFPAVPVDALGGAPDGSVLLAGGSLGMYASRDGGDTWSHTGAGLGFPSMNAVGANADGSVLFAGGRNWINSAYLQVSRDGGATWDTFLPDPNDGGVQAFAAHPDDPDRAWAAVWVDLAESHVLETTDRGQTWTAVLTSALHVADLAYHAPSASLLVGTEAGVLARPDGAPAFVPIGVAPLGSYAVTVAGDVIMAEGQGTSIWSNQAGLPVLAPWGDTGDFIDSLATEPTGTTAWAGTAGGLVRCDAAAGPVGAVCVDDAPAAGVRTVWTDVPSGTVWAATADSGLFRASV